MPNAHSLKGLMKWLAREEWRQPYGEWISRHLGPPCERFEIAFDELAEKIGDENAAVVSGCVFEDFLSTDLDDDRNIVDDYLKRRGWKESVPNRRYMMALRSSVMSLYEVSDIVRDQSFLARDLLRGGEPVRISEKSATRSLKQWDRIAARVVRMGTRVEMSGGVLAFRYELAETVRETFATLRKEMLSDVRNSGERRDEEVEPFAFDTEVLRHSAFLFTHVWLDDVLEQVLNPTPPKLYNSDGDEIVAVTVRYPLKEACDRAALEAALSAMPDLHGTGENLWNWSATAAPGAAKAPKSGEIIASIFEEGSVSMGSIELQAKTLSLETNSRQRASRAQALLEPVIGPFVGASVMEQQTVAEMWASRPADDAPVPPSSLSLAEQRVITHEMIERHYRAVLDQPVPMLGNVSPRKAARTKKGREELIDWLKLLENSLAQDADSPMAGYDLRWMWDELGIAHLRR